METFSKSESKQLRTLAGIGYERELAAALAQLDGQFAEWRAGTLSPFEVSDAIHAFHKGPARQLYVFYTGKPSTCVAHALASGILREAEVSSELVSRLRPMVEFFRTGAKEVEPAV